MHSSEQYTKVRGTTLCGPDEPGARLTNSPKYGFAHQYRDSCTRCYRITKFTLTSRLHILTCGSALLLRTDRVGNLRGRGRVERISEPPTASFASSSSSSAGLRLGPGSITRLALLQRRSSSGSFGKTLKQRTLCEALGITTLERPTCRSIVPWNLYHKVCRCNITILQQVYLVHV